KLAALHRHTSQVYEWLPYNSGTLAEVPADEAGRRQWLRHWLQADARRAEANRDLLGRLYGPERAAAARYAEVFEICELGRRPDEAELRRLFPLL
ncbi:MAG: PIG-L family deacetylase, partial [Candidatus Dormibacteria bacterium]